MAKFNEQRKKNMNLVLVGEIEKYSINDAMKSDKKIDTPLIHLFTEILYLCYYLHNSCWFFDVIERLN